jgi:hypothetical protein
MPVCAPSAIIERISSSLTARAVFFGSLSRLTTSSVAVRSTQTSGALRNATISIGRASAAAMASGFVSAQRFGTSSPTTTERNVTPTTTIA